MKQIEENTPLYTKDGTKIGNALVIKRVAEAKKEKKKHDLYKIKTDYGTVLFLDRKEIDEFYSVGFGHMDPVEQEIAKSNMHTHKHFHQTLPDAKFPSQAQMFNLTENYIKNSKIEKIIYHSFSGNWVISYNYDVPNDAFDDFDDLVLFLQSDQK
jgi:hypothetical protein